LKIATDADFNGILHVKPQNSSYRIQGRLNSTDLNSMTTQSGKQRGSAYKKINETKELQQ